MGDDVSGGKAYRKAMADVAALFARKTPSSWVYLSTFDGLFKVGTTIKMPDDRIKQVAKRYDADCSLICAMPGNRALEQKILRSLHRYRAFGRCGSKEVFDLPPNILAKVILSFGGLAS